MCEIPLRCPEKSCYGSIVFDGCILQFLTSHITLCIVDLWLNDTSCSKIVRTGKAEVPPYKHDFTTFNFTPTLSFQTLIWRIN